MLLFEKRSKQAQFLKHTKWQPYREPTLVLIRIHREYRIRKETAKQLWLYNDWLIFYKLYLNYSNDKLLKIKEENILKIPVSVLGPRLFRRVVIKPRRLDTTRCGELGPLPPVIVRLRSFEKRAAVSPVPLAVAVFALGCSDDATVVDRSSTFQNWLLLSSKLYSLAIFFLTYCLLFFIFIFFPFFLLFQFCWFAQKQQQKLHNDT